VRGETSPQYTNLPRFTGVAGRMRELLGDRARVIYMVRDPIDRILSHYLHNVGGGYETRTLADALADPDSSYVARSRYAMQLRPYLDSFDRSHVLVVDNAELAGERAGTMRRVFGFAGVDEAFRSEQFDREWETGGARAAEGGGFRLMDRAVRLPGLRAIDRNFDRLPESLRWVVERIIHDPGRGAAPKPELPDDLRARLTELLADDVRELEERIGRSLGWL
jgi:hypothetical protein